MISLQERKTMFRNTILAATAAALSALTVAGATAAAEDQRRGPLEALKAVFGIAADPARPDAVLLATEYGLLRATPDGFAEAMPQVPLAVVGLTALPGRASDMMLSGFAEDGPGGVRVSSDGGETWSVLPGTEGADGIALTSLSVSRANPDLVAGLGKEIMLSSDGGTTWTAVAETPKDTFSVALAGGDTPRLYAGTMTGLQVSTDGGASWTAAAPDEAPVTAVAELSGGRVAAFVYGKGVIVAPTGETGWTTVGTGFEDRYLRTITEAPDGTLYGAADTGAVLLSRDGGASWTSFEGSDLATPERIAAGKALYADTCQACHGVGGIGESPDDPGAKDEFGFKAPALNNDQHAWHHSDAGLRATIHKGSPRNERMIAWEEQLSDDEIDSIIAYIKSLWTIRSLACQGARHMGCQGQ